MASGRASSDTRRRHRRSGSLHPATQARAGGAMDAIQKMSTKAASSTSQILLDSRAAADLSGEKGSHIPGAGNAFWMENQGSRENKTLQSEAALHSHYEKLGVTPDRKVVTYCNSGMQAS